MTEDQDDNWIPEFVAGCAIAAVIVLALFIAFFLFGYIAARLGFI